MSFTLGSLSTSSSLTFGPSLVDIGWDGISNGKITIKPVCGSSASTGTYTVKVLHVHQEATTKTLYSAAGTASQNWNLAAGIPFRYHPNATSGWQEAAPFVVGNTQNTATGDVSFELIPADARYTNTLEAFPFNVGTNYPTISGTSQSSYYKWWIERSRGTATQVVAVGKIIRIPPNPYSSVGVYGTLVEAQTASFCIG